MHDGGPLREALIPGSLDARWGEPNQLVVAPDVSVLHLQSNIPEGVTKVIGYIPVGLP